MTVEIRAENLDWRALLQPGDRLVVSQTNAEPGLLLDTLVAQRADLGRPSLFLGPVGGPQLRPEHADHLDFVSYCGTALNRNFTARGVMDIVPGHFTELAGAFASGTQGCDVALVLLREDGRGYNTGITHDYTREAAGRARLVVAEVNDLLPVTFGGEWPDTLRPDIVVRSTRPIQLLPALSPGETERQIARHVAGLVPDSATLEIGIGALPAQVLAELRGHRDLGFHSGVIADAAVALIEAGVITNARKPIDTGVSIAGLLFGGQATLDFAHRNPHLRLAPASYTHTPKIAAQLPAFHAINGAIEVDLTGQVNSEVAGGRYIGSIGGQVDFARCAAASKGGRSIIMLPSTARGGEISCITSALAGGTVTLGRADADTVVTEWGVAELRGQTLRERMRRMIAIAHPKYREGLERAAFAQQKASLL